MSDLVKRLREHAEWGEAGPKANDGKLLCEAAATIEAQAAEIERLRALANAIGMARDTAERAFTDICEELGCKPDNEAALEAVAALRGALAKAVEVLRPFANRVPANRMDRPDGTIVARAGMPVELFKAARAFITEHGSDSKGE